jgi:hypothetical protein
MSEIERLRLENWQLKGALGYPVPSDIPEGPFKCGLCDARAKALEVRGWTEEERDGMAEAFKRAHQRHGFYETLFAVAAFILRHRAQRL